MRFGLICVEPLQGNTDEDTGDLMLLDGRISLMDIVQLRKQAIDAAAVFFPYL